MSRDNDRRSGGFGEALILLAVILFGFFVQPGLLAVYVTDCVLGLELDRGQLWSFGSVSAFVMYALTSVRDGRWWAGLGTYSWLCFGCTITLVLATWGFHARWPFELWARLFGG